MKKLAIIGDLGLAEIAVYIHSESHASVRKDLNNP